MSISLIPEISEEERKLVKKMKCKIDRDNDIVLCKESPYDVCIKECPNLKKCWGDKI